MSGEKGFALVITLIVAALLVALTVEFVNEVYVDTSARQNFVDGQQASLMANSGVVAGRALLQYALARPGQDYTSIADLDRLEKMLQLADENGSVQVAVEEESGKLDINSIVSPNGKVNEVYFDVATRLFKKLGLPPGLLYAVVDWIDANDEPQPAGAETSYYQALKPPYAAKNAPLQSLEELRLVKGFDTATIQRLRPYITVYSANIGIGGAPVNVNTAAKELLASLDEAMSDDLAQRILDYRKTTPLKSATDLSVKVPGMERLALELGRQNVIMNTQEKGSVFRLLARAQVGETVRVIEAVVGDGQPLYWREY